jgi:hypothetical protein
MQFVWIDYGENFPKYIFRITYTAQQDVKLQTEKIKSLNHKSTLIDNQDNQYVNVELFAKNSLSTLNRLGNNERTITAIYDDFNEIPVLGDYIEDYILTTREISIYDNYCVFKGTLTKDFADKYQFNAINSKKRFYNISDEKIVRHEIKKRYLIYSYENNNKENDEYNNYTEQARLLLTGSKLVPEYIILKPFKNDEYELVLECNSYFAGNAVLTTFGFDDNVVAGNATDSKTTGGYSQMPCSYCDKYGENFSYEVFAFDSYSYSVNFSGPVEYEDFWEKYSKHLPFQIRAWESIEPYEYPFKPLNACKYKIDFNHHKDQREVLKWTIQNVIVSDNDNIVLGEALYEELVQNKADSLNMQLVRLNTGRFTARNNNSITDYSIIEKIAYNAIEREGNSLKINASGNIALIYKDRLYLGLNDYVANTPIYLNIRDER